MKDSAASSPEEATKSMQAWMAWAEKCGEKLVDFGSPLVGGLSLNPDGMVRSSNKNVAGYSLLQAESMEEAKALLLDHPHLKWDASCEIEVHETMPIPGP